MFNLGMGEITVIVLLALIFIGPKKLPELASGLGKLIREIRKTTSDVKNEITLDDAIRKPLEELREAVTLHPDELKRRDRIRQELEAARQVAQKLEEQEKAAAAAAEASSGATGTEASSPLTDGDSSPATPPPVPAVASAGLPPPVPAPGLTPAAGPGGRLAPPSLGFSPPTGTVSRDPLRPGTTLASPLGARTTSRLSAVTGPPADSAADRSNTTQALSEADLAAIAVGMPIPPPPPPIGARTGRTALPPLPISSGKSGPIKTALANEPKSGPIVPPSAASPADDQKPEPAT